MTPLRREVNLPIYWLVVGLAVMVVSPPLSIISAVKISEHSAQEQAERANVAEAKARTESRRQACELFGGILDTYVETPPTTPAGKNVRDKWLYFYTSTGCQPPRTK